MRYYTSASRVRPPIVTLHRQFHDTQEARWAETDGRRTAHPGRRGRASTTPLVKALVRAFRWRRMLDDGVHATLEDLVKAKGVNATYVSRVLRLMLLATTTIVKAVLDRGTIRHGRRSEGERSHHLGRLPRNCSRTRSTCLGPHQWLRPKVSRTPMNSTPSKNVSLMGNSIVLQSPTSSFWGKISS